MITIRWPNIQPRYPVVEFRRIFRHISRPVPLNAEMVTAYTDGSVTLRSNRRIGGYHEAADMSGMQGVKSGDFVVHGLDILRGSVGVSDSDGAISSVCVVCESIAGADLRYYAWLLRAQAHAGLPKALARGVREGGADFRRWDTLAELPVLCPSVKLQRAIADYLELEISRIDDLIGKKKRLIESLQQLRKTQIDAAFRGQDNRQISSPIHVSWPGLAPPREWALLPFGALARKVSRNSIGGEQLLSVYLENGVIPHSDDGTQVHAPAVDRSSYQSVRIGDLVMNNQQAWRGSVGITSLDGIVSPAYHVYEISDVLDPAFANFLFRSPIMVGQYEQVSRGVGTIQRNLSHSDLRQVKVPVPPKSEQHAISSRLERVVEYTNLLVGLCVAQVETLSEYRSALIFAAVTGELEIPEVAA